MDERKLRSWAHSRLQHWAVNRDDDLSGLGWAGVSATERMRERAHGGDSSTAEGELTLPERQAADCARTLQTEIAVRDLEPHLRRALKAKYLEHRVMRLWAAENGIEPYEASRWVSRGMLRVGQYLAATARNAEAAVDVDATIRAERCAEAVELAIVARGNKIAVTTIPVADTAIPPYSSVTVL